MPDRTRKGMYAAAAAIVAGFLFAAGSATKQKPRNLARPSLPLLPEERAGEEDSFRMNLEHVSYFCDSSKVTREGRRGTLIAASDGTKLEGVRPCEMFHVDWPRFTLSVVDGGGPRRVFVNPSQVVEVVKSIFRRTNKPRPDTVIYTLGGSIVVRESVEDVRAALGRGGASS